MPIALERSFKPQAMEVVAKPRVVVKVPVFESAKLKQHKTYEHNFDTQKYRELAVLKKQAPDAYEKRKKALDAETMFNLETAIGERLNAGLSRRIDSVKDGRICNVHTGEALEEIYERGRKYRKRNGSSEHDQKREEAEVIGFKQIQRVLLDDATPEGTMMLSISPPGGKDSIYNHNFYDVFTKKRNEKGEIEIESRRYSSGLEREEYVKKAEGLQSDYFMQTGAFTGPLDAHFLAHPIKIDPRSAYIKSADQLHKEFHKTHESLSEKEFQAVLRVITPLMLAYIAVLADDSSNIKDRNMTYDAILNKADEVIDVLKGKGKAEYSKVYTDERVREIDKREIWLLAQRPVRAVDTGCGFSAGASSSGGTSGGIFGSAFSVREFSSSGSFGEDRYGKRSFECPSCDRTNTRPYNQLLKECQHCGSAEVGC